MCKFFIFIYAECVPQGRYVLVIPQYEYNVLVITQVQGEAEDAVITTSVLGYS